MAIAVVSGAFLWNRRGGTDQPAINSVAVLPFESSAQDPDIEYIADGLTDGLIDHLARAKSLKVQARATVMRFKGNPNPQEAARALSVGAVVTGALSRRGTQIVVSAELIHGATGERLWGQTFDRPVADLMRVQDTIVLSIAEGLRLRLSGEEKARLGGFGTDNPEAYELFLKGRFLLQRETEEDDLEALRLFKLAAEKDPNFFDAHLAVANTYGRMVGGGLQSSRDAGVHADEALAKAFAHRSEQRRRASGDGAEAIRHEARLGGRRARISRRDGRSDRPPYHSCGTRSPSSSWPSGGPTRPRRWSSARSSSMPATSNLG